jgi:hypothetical protein
MTQLLALSSGSLPQELDNIPKDSEYDSLKIPSIILFFSPQRYCQEMVLDHFLLISPSYILQDNGAFPQLDIKCLVLILFQF